MELIGLIVFGSVAYAASKGAPWVPTWKHDLQTIVTLAALEDGHVFYELGCGDGRVCTAVSDAYPRARVIGVELGLIQWMVAQMRRLWRGRANVVFRWADALKTPLHDADVVYMYLMPEPYARLRPMLETSLRPGTRVITYVWPMEGWEPEQVITDGTAAVYVYKR